MLDPVARVIDRDRHSLGTEPLLPPASLSRMNKPVAPSFRSREGRAQIGVRAIALWLGVLGAAPFLLTILIVLAPRSEAVFIAGAVGVLVAGATVAFGCRLRVHKTWRLVVNSALVGTALLLTEYALTCILAEINDPHADQAAGVGVGILMIPTFALLMGLLSVGAGLAGTASVVKRRSLTTRDHGPSRVH